MIDSTEGQLNVIPEENCEDIMHTPTGLCPCCGCEVNEVDFEVPLPDGVDSIEAIMQVCPRCRWVSVPLYDE